ncbi:hypothetical protein RJ640_023493 [Escallonia rubra]|uniref:Uncharacterized protein n=1 Tax=Escallonia rubra TaxID=112253 RepID=A0AA88SJ67_9ASTE|nr:hypothetical protein RJ640_023493 [Escallonia rubra]
MIVTASQLALYDQIKETMLENGVMRDGLVTHVTASFAAGFVAAVASNPIDVIKMRVMNMKVEPGSAILGDTGLCPQDNEFRERLSFSWALSPQQKVKSRPVA